MVWAVREILDLKFNQNFATVHIKKQMGLPNQAPQLQLRKLKFKKLLFNNQFFRVHLPTV